MKQIISETELYSLAGLKASLVCPGEGAGLGVSAQEGCLPRGCLSKGCLLRGVCSGGLSAQGGCLPRGCLPGGVCPPSPSPRGQADACKILHCPKLRLWAVKNRESAAVSRRISLADLRGCQGRAPHWGSKFFHSHAVFGGKKYAK